METKAMRSRMSAAQRREQILDVTHRIVDSAGFHAATPARIADEAGVHRSLLYQMFGDLPGLFVALIDREMGRASTQYEAVLASAPPRGVARLRAVLVGAVAAVDEAPATWRLFLVPPEGAPPEYHARLAEAQAVVLALLTEVLIDVGSERVPDPDLTARVLHAAGREILCYRLLDPESAAVDRLLAVADPLLGLAVSPRQ